MPKLIKLHEVHMRDTKEVTDDIWVNTEYILYIRPCKNENTVANSYITIQYEYSWHTFNVTETPEQISKLTMSGYDI